MARFVGRGQPSLRDFGRCFWTHPALRAGYFRTSALRTSCWSGELPQTRVLESGTYGASKKVRHTVQGAGKLGHLKPGISMAQATVDRYHRSQLPHLFHGEIGRGRQSVFGWWREQIAGPSTAPHFTTPTCQLQARLGPGLFCSAQDDKVVGCKDRNRTRLCSRWIGHSGAR